MFDKITSESVEVINLFSQFVTIYVFCMLGSYIHEFLSTFNKRKKKINVVKFMTTAFVSTVLVFSLLDYINVNIKIFIGMCFFLGVISEEIARLVMTVDGWVKIYKYSKAITKGVKDGIHDIESADDK